MSILLFLLWILLNGRVTPEIVVIGAGVAAALMLFMSRFLGWGVRKERDFLPLAFADYIFAIIVEESGIIGAILLIAIYLAILFRACWTSTRFNDYAALLMVMGLALMITCQALISMMVAVGIGPVTGQPLPMISRGGTSAIITSVYFGIMMCVSREQNMLAARQDATREASMNDVPDIELE